MFLNIVKNQPYDDYRLRFSEKRIIFEKLSMVNTKKITLQVLTL